MSDVHITDEQLVPDYWVPYCKAKVPVGTLSQNPAHATCPACIEAYETRPQPVTTKDLLDVLRLAGWLAREGPPRTGGCPARAAASRLEAKLARPRQAKPPAPPPEPRCGKCQTPIDPDDDCPRCYPR